MTMTADPVAQGPVEIIMEIIRSAAQPLTLAQIQKQYKGPKIAKTRVKEVVEEKLIDGKLFQCSPSGKNPRYWVHDEYQQISDRLEQALTVKDQGEKELVKTVTDALGKVTTAKAVKEVLAQMRVNKRVHDHPGKGKTPILSLRPYDALASLTLKAATLKELKGLFDRVRQANVPLDRFLHRLGELISPPESLAQPSAPPENREELKCQPRLMDVASSEPSGENEVRQLVLKAVEEAGPAVPVSVSELRRQLPESYRATIFDDVVWDLVEKEQLFVFRHNQAGLLSESERAELLKDDKGNYYVDLAQRPK